jgi:hypothetical protein
MRIADGPIRVLVHELAVPRLLKIELGVKGKNAVQQE